MALVMSTIQVTIRISSVKFPERMINGNTTYLHLQILPWDWRGGKYSPVPCTGDSAHKTFGPADLTSTYSMCTRRVFSGFGHRTQAFRYEVRCSSIRLHMAYICFNTIRCP
ncbi:hypothetical protein TNCV_3549581 [Trichonephila clavipes]|nr:hypothetical protein TNCV_3549581 [Trichonephila clavipes]